MNQLRVLYISGSLGLGHITRDMAIANELRRRIPDIKIDWLAVHPASELLQKSGETIVPEASEYENENFYAEKSAKGNYLNLLSYLLKSKSAWKKNTKVFAKIVTSRQYDLVIGDETYEISLVLREHPELKKFPFVMIFDFVGLNSMTNNPLEKLGVYIYNKKWAYSYIKNQKPSYDLGLFVGEPEDIPDNSFGFKLPNRRVFANAMYKFVGYIFPFDPANLTDQPSIRKKLGYGSEPLIIASIGGTSIGKELLEVCGAAFPILKKTIPLLRMILVTGPRIEKNSLKVPDGVEVQQFIPQLYEHFAACDLAIVQGGATSTLELTALQKPFVYFPLEGHSEQAGVARNLTRRHAGIQMKFSKTTPVLLANKISEALNSKMTYPMIPTDGAKKASQLIIELLRENRKIN
jgi:UDP:flavonoid glycosyltransferase YjiC (YdhE family)